MSAAAKKEAPRPILTSVKVIGVGGAGNNAVSRMNQDFHLRGVEFFAINTDSQDLDQCDVRRKIHIGRNLTRGMGTGMNPDIGRQAAEENRSEIAEAIQGADLVFISAGLGGGTGSGASPVVAEVAKQSGALTIAVVTKPFTFEGTQRERIAADALLRLKEKVDALIVVPNDRIFSVISKDTPLMKAFQAIDEVLRNAIVGIVELILMPGIINVDFADMRAIVSDAGSAIIGIGIASGPDRSVQAINQALNSPLVEVSAEGAHGVLLGVAGGRDMRMNEINDAARLVTQTVDPSAKIIFGAYFDRKLKPNQIKVTLIATGFNDNHDRTAPLFGARYEPKTASLLYALPALNNAAASEIEPLEAKTKGSTFRGESSVKLPGSNGSGSADSILKPAPIEPVRFSSPSKSADSPASTPDFFASTGNGRPAPTKPEPAPESKKRETDIWDIPTFLRKKKR